MTNVLRKVENLKVVFNDNYNRKHGTMDQEIYSYIMRKVFEIIIDLKTSNVNPFLKFYTKSQVQSIGLKSELARKTFKEENYLTKLFNHMDEHNEAKFIGTSDKLKEYLVVKKVRDMNKENIFIITRERIVGVPYSTYQTKNENAFKNQLQTISKDYTIMSYDHYNKKHL